MTENGKELNQTRFTYYVWVALPDLEVYRGGGKVYAVLVKLSRRWWK